MSFMERYRGHLVLCIGPMHGKLTFQMKGIEIFSTHEHLYPRSGGMSAPWKSLEMIDCPVCICLDTFILSQNINYFALVFALIFFLASLLD